MPSLGPYAIVNIVLFEFALCHQRVLTQTEYDAADSSDASLLEKSFDPFGPPVGLLWVRSGPYVCPERFLHCGHCVLCAKRARMSAHVVQLHPGT